MSSLSEIAPNEPQLLMDLVNSAGVDVSDWANFKKGKAYAAANRRYCYNWAFVQPGKVVVLNLWHELMEEDGDGVVMRNLNMRDFAAKRRGAERRRSLYMDGVIQLAIKENLPIRVIVLDGRRRNIKNPGEKASKVSKRLLDPMSWSVKAYDWETGECTLVRGFNHFADQFVIEEESKQKPERRLVSGEVFIRNAMVRSNVLLRAKGKCEWCGKTGFIMDDGRIYLETHHVVPLSEGGTDSERNVAALCPNHHREAHHGKTKEEMRKTLLQRLGAY